MKERTDTDIIIFHHSLSNYGDVNIIRGWHLDRGFEDIGYHDVVLRNGTIQHGRDYRLVGAHAYGRNSNSIGICLVGDFSKYEPSLEQIEACLHLFHGYCRIYNKNLEIEFHRGVTERHPCPGKMLDRKDFLEIMFRGRI